MEVESDPSKLVSDNNNNNNNNNIIDNKANYKILFTINFTWKTIQVKHDLYYYFWLKKKKTHLISVEKIHSIKNISYIRKKIPFNNKKTVYFN